MGWFPASFVQLMDAPGAGAAAAPANDTAEGKAEEAPANQEGQDGVMVKGLYDYNAQQEDELSFKVI